MSYAPILCLWHVFLRFNCCEIHFRLVNIQRIFDLVNSGPAHVTKMEKTLNTKNTNRNMPFICGQCFSLNLYTLLRSKYDLIRFLIYSIWRKIEKMYQNKSLLSEKKSAGWNSVSQAVHFKWNCELKISIGGESGLYFFLTTGRCRIIPFTAHVLDIIQQHNYWSNAMNNDGFRITTREKSLLSKLYFLDEHGKINNRIFLQVLSTQCSF